MWLIDKTFKDTKNSYNKSSLYLNADKIVDYSNIEYPILWTGLLNGTKITIKQLEESSYSIKDYEFVEFPEQYDYLKAEVVNAIDSYLRILD